MMLTFTLITTRILMITTICATDSRFLTPVETRVSGFTLMDHFIHTLMFTGVWHAAT